MKRFHEIGNRPNSSGAVHGYSGMTPGTRENLANLMWLDLVGDDAYVHLKRAP